MSKLEGKVFLAFGSASGMGKATAKLFAAQGAKVIVADVSGEAALSVADEINRSGGKAVARIANVYLEEDIAAAVQFAVDTYGKLDILLYQPGRNTVSSLVDLDTEVWNDVIKLNLTGPFLAIKYAAKAMEKTGGGSILVTSSLNSTMPCKKFAAYCSTKSAVDMLVRVAALELGPKIRVNTINPGFMNTPQIAPFTSNQPLMDVVMKSHSTDRIGQPEDFARLALFLSSDDSGYITGANYIMDGGLRNYGYPDIIEMHLENKRRLAAEAQAKADAGA